MSEKHEVIWHKHTKRGTWGVIRITYNDGSAETIPAIYRVKRTADGEIRYWEDARWFCPKYVFQKALNLSDPEAPCPWVDKGLKVVTE